MQKSGLKEVEIVRSYATIFGTLQLFKATFFDFPKGIPIIPRAFKIKK